MQGHDFPLPSAVSPIQEACVDGGKVRLRTPLGEISVWRDYKAIVTPQDLVANLYDNQFLLNWLNAQPLATPITCLGDGHDGIGKIIAAIAIPEQRREILAW